MLSFLTKEKELPIRKSEDLVIASGQEKRAILLGWLFYNSAPC